MSANTPAPAAPGSLPTLDSYTYATQWCQTIINEPDECQRGARDALNILGPNVSALSPPTASQLRSTLDTCTKFEATEGYRYGCYLAAAFSAQGTPKGYCDIQITDEQKAPLTLALPCADTCRALFPDSQQMSRCLDSAQYQFNQLVQPNTGRCGEPVYSCIHGLESSGQGFDCSNSGPNRDGKGDRDNLCLPMVVGCTLGALQSQTLLQVEKYQQQNGLPVLGCDSVMYPEGGGFGKGITGSQGGGGGSGVGGRDGGSNGGRSSWNPWPEGSTYDANVKWWKDNTPGKQ